MDLPQFCHVAADAKSETVLRHREIAPRHPLVSFVFRAQTVLHERNRLIGGKFLVPAYCFSKIIRMYELKDTHRQQLFLREPGRSGTPDSLVENDRRDER